MKVIKLDKKVELVLKPLTPYNFDASVFKPSHYSDALKHYEKGKYWFALRFDNKIYGIRLESMGSIKKPKIKISIYSNSKISKDELNKIIEEISFRFEFNKDISEFYEKFKKNKILLKFLKRWYGMHNSCAQDLYGLLMIGIFLQNTVIRRTVQMTKIMLENYGTKVIFDNKEIYIFWKPEEIIKVSEEELRNLKIGYRAKLFMKLSKTFIEENLNEFELRRLPLEEAKKKLLSLYGIGPETARILVFEALHYDSFLEHVSPWQQKILSKLLFNKKLVSVEKIINYVNKNFEKWATLAVHYIWEDIFWQRKQGKTVEWLDKEIRL